MKQITVKMCCTLLISCLYYTQQNVGCQYNSNINVGICVFNNL